MNPYIDKIYKQSSAPSRTIIGLMSGTSLDGLDVALCRITGSGLATQTEVLHFKTIPYPAAFKEELKSVSFQEQVDMQKVTLLNAYIGSYHGELILSCLEEWGVAAADVDAIASHGQTIFHAPQSKHQRHCWPNATLQIGDADHIAVKTGIITLSDFRQKHIAAGGEGAPLAVYGDYLIFSSPEEHRILLNIGGIANFTYLPAGHQAGQVFSTDVGPGNTMMDQYVQKHFPGMHYDENAAIARQGSVHEGLLTSLLSDPFFSLPFPKTTGPELFNLSYLEAAMQKAELDATTSLAPEDVLATLCEFTAAGIVDAMEKALKDIRKASVAVAVYLSGGGMHNPLLVSKISERLGQELKNTNALALDPDAKEAVLFALLANECITGSRLDFGNRAGLPAVLMGKISFPA